MKIDPDYDIVGAREQPDSRVAILLKKGDVYTTAIINHCDLDPLINNGVLLDVEGDPFNIAFIKLRRRACE